MSTLHAVHASLPVHTVWVHESVFYNMDSSKTKWVKAKLIGLSILQGTVPCFEILTDEGALFSNVPPHLVCTVEPICQPGADINVYMNDLVYFNAPSIRFSLCRFEHLAGLTVQGFDPATRKPTYQATYICSIDFYEDNNWCHLIKRQDGFFAFMPSHKLLFVKGGKEIDTSLQLPAYQKLRQEFKL